MDRKEIIYDMYMSDNFIIFTYMYSKQEIRNLTVKR